MSVHVRERESVCVCWRTVLCVAKTVESHFFVPDGDLVSGASESHHSDITVTTHGAWPRQPSLNFRTSLWCCHEHGLRLLPPAKYLGAAVFRGDIIWNQISEQLTDVRCQLVCVRVSNKSDLVFLM